LGLGERGAQILALDQLHREVQLAVGLAEVEHLDDVAVVELDGDPRLVDEAADEATLPRLRRQDALERLDLLEAGDADGLHLVDLGHAALRDALEHVVLAEALAAQLHLGADAITRARCYFRVNERRPRSRPARGAARLPVPRPQPPRDRAPPQLVD